jgi:two-component system, OmpR family, response regulator
MRHVLLSAAVDCGAGDGLDESFELAEVARLEILARGPEDLRATRLRAGDLEMDLIERTVRRGGSEIALTPRAFKVLEYFLRRPGQLVTRAMLLKDVWNYRFVPETNAVDVQIGALRRKIDSAGRPSLIVNVRGAGFRLDAAP